MNSNQIISEGLRLAIKELYTTEASDQQIQLQRTRKEFEGDITIVVFPFLKISEKSPEITGQEIGNFLKNSVALVSDYNVVKGNLFRYIEVP